MSRIGQALMYIRENKFKTLTFCVLITYTATLPFAYYFDAHLYSAKYRTKEREKGNKKFSILGEEE